MNISSQGIESISGITAFVATVDAGGFAAASRRLGLSASAVGKAVARLEARVGVRLLNRTTRRLSLTEAGAQFLERAERILADLGEAESEVSAHSFSIEGLLRVSGPVSFGVLHLAGLAAQSHARQPGVTIELGLNDRYVDLLEERWDVAIRIGRLADSALIARKLASARLSLCAAPSYLARKGRPADVADLARHDCLGYTLAPIVPTR